MDDYLLLYKSNFDKTINIACLLSPYLKLINYRTHQEVTTTETELLFEVNKYVPHHIDIILPAQRPKLKDKMFGVQNNDQTEYQRWKLSHNKSLPFRICFVCLRNTM